MKSSRIKKQSDHSLTLLEDTSKPLTVKDLREILALLKDDLPVLVEDQDNGVLHPLRALSGEYAYQEYSLSYILCDPYSKDARNVVILKT